MVVIGGQTISFVVTQFENGVQNEDCEERYLDSNEHVDVLITRNSREMGNRKHKL
jgi:hypothetical protein